MCKKARRNVTGISTYRDVSQACCSIRIVRLMRHHFLKLLKQVKHERCGHFDPTKCRDGGYLDFKTTPQPNEYHSTPLTKHHDDLYWFPFSMRFVYQHKHDRVDLGNPDDHADVERAITMTAPPGMRHDDSINPPHPLTNEDEVFVHDWRVTNTVDRVESDLNRDPMRMKALSVPCSDSVKAFSCINWFKKRPIPKSANNRTNGMLRDLERGQLHRHQSCKFPIIVFRTVITN